MADNNTQKNPPTPAQRKKAAQAATGAARLKAYKELHGNSEKERRCPTSSELAEYVRADDAGER